MTEETTTQVVTASGEKIETTLPADKVADLQALKEPEKPAAEPAKPEQPSPAPAPAPAVEPKPADPAKPAEPPAPASESLPKGKSKPIANLLSKNHELQTQLEASNQARAELEAKLAAAATQPASPAATNKVKALAEQYGIDETLLAEIVATAREGLNPNPQVQLPKEVQDLIAERAAQKEHDAELAIANTRITKLAGIFKDEPIATHKDKLLELAYSTEKAPDGERYCDKELSELYFGFIKPEIEPAKPSAEPSRGGAGASTGVVDFAEIHGDDAKLEEFATTATSEQWKAYEKWRDSVQGDVPIRHKK